MDDLDHRPQLLEPLLNIGIDDIFHPENKQPYDWDFYQWKSYDQATYWDVHFPSEFQKPNSKLSGAYLSTILLGTSLPKSLLLLLTLLH